MVVYTYAVINNFKSNKMVENKESMGEKHVLKQQNMVMETLKWLRKMDVHG
jgi:hypothetical protein